ncbi:CoB--CoM heterodisulfide reductase iron-sulfur subunit B family protein [Rosettibacter firmus]|uniref:CoB--CoM heterodisulfide reductase iron-sulfur subunit B family protein n=1 Tax=Rosettibacter firmus TaxID=3111522 RepID=UPI00336C02C5
MKYAYYPGCSLHTVNNNYDKSCRAVFNALNCELVELEDWNCCGATIYMSIKEITALAVAARNLALAERIGYDIVTPCSSCYTILNKANKYLKSNNEVFDKVNLCLKEAGLSYNGTVRVRHPLDILVNDIGIEIIKLNVKIPLIGLRIANYYGCQIVRPEKGFDDRENPMSMENLFENIGAEDVYFPYKLRCCGGMLMTTYQSSSLNLTKEILECAQENGADCIATTCPLCQMNLEGYQNKINRIYSTTYKIPILFFTQILGVALGIDVGELGLEQNFYKCDKLESLYKVSLNHQK